MRFWSIETTKPLISYSTPVALEPLRATHGAGLASRYRHPSIARSSASITVCGRSCGLSCRLIDTPKMSLGRLKLMILALAASELGITAMLPWAVCRRVARQSMSVTRPSVPSMEIQSSSW
ncbi:hypothetical protein FQZ97_982490 [compost metagenome]